MKLVINAQVTLTRLVNVLLKKILYSLQILTKSVPKAITNANLLVQFLACIQTS